MHSLTDNKEAQRILFSKLPERVQAIIGKGLNKYSGSLSEDDSLDILTACIEIGVERAEMAVGKTAVMVVGNTGAGKSTFVNYILKCVFEKVLLEGKKKPVYMVSENSPVKEVMSIGHSKTSHSFVPDLAEAHDLESIVVDCPGFLDNRGAEISIANATNIKAVMTQATGVTLVAVLNYHSLGADRGRGVRELLDTLIGLFGSVDRAIIHAKSILLVVSHVPEITADGYVELEDVKDEFSTDGLSLNMATLLDALLDRVCIFHPENKGGQSWLTAVPLSECIKASPLIYDPAEVFKIVLSIADESKLRALVEALFKRLKAALDSGNYEVSVKALSDMKRLDMVDHVTVTRLLESAKVRVSQTLLNITFEAQTYVLTDNLKGAEVLVAKFRNILMPFSATPAVRNMLDLSQLATRADAIEKTIEIRREEMARRERQSKETEEVTSTLDSLKRDLAVAEALQRESLKAEEDLKSELAQFKAKAAEDTARLMAQDKAHLEALEDKLSSANTEEIKNKVEAFKAEHMAKFAGELRERQDMQDKQSALFSNLLKEQEKSRLDREEAERRMRDAVIKAEADKAIAEDKMAEEARLAREFKAKFESERQAMEEVKKAEETRRIAELKKAEEEQGAREAEEARKAEETRLLEKARQEAERLSRRNADEKAEREAIERIVQASDSYLNWSHELPMASWNCVITMTDAFEVKLGLFGDNKCGFEFTSEFELCDLIRIFGAILTVLDVNGQKKCSGKNLTLSYSILSNFDDISSILISGDINVLKRAPSVQKIYLRETNCSGNFIRISFYFDTCAVLLSDFTYKTSAIFPR